MPVTTRSASPDDAPAVALAHARAWQVAYRGLVPDAYLDAIDVAERADMWRGFLCTETPTDYVAEVDGSVVGFVNVGRFRAEPSVSEFGEVWAMYVHPDHWGVGAGYALMQRSVEHFRTEGVTTGYLWVFEDNPRARRFYERQGWTADDATQIDVTDGVEVVERRYSLPLA